MAQKMKHKHFNKDIVLRKMIKKISRTLINVKFVIKKYSEKDVRVRDHCHITGKYRGSAYQDCNINYRLTDKIPVIFHSLKGYDSHFIMQTIGEIAHKHTYKNKKGKEKQMDINVITNDMEKYTAFMLGKHLGFIDSLQFMCSSLDKLVSNLPNNAKKLKRMKQKCVYSYNYMVSFNRFSKKKLPNKGDFYGILNDEHISDTQYVRAIKVWNTFKLKNMGEYHDLYLKSDVHFLADVFENSRKTCM